MSLTGVVGIDTRSDICVTCKGSSCDVKIKECGCTMHTRCLPIKTIPLSSCPACGKEAKTIYLFPLLLTERNSRHSFSMLRPSSPLDRKRGAEDYGDSDFAPNHRTGRWTIEEITYTDEIINHFDAGTLPLPNGLKLVDFLGSLLLSKPSRLTKKLKNAKLSAKCYKRTTGHVCDGHEMNSSNDRMSHNNNPQEQQSGYQSCKDSQHAASFSRLEDLFIKSLPDYSTTSEIKFMSTHNWRDWFSNMCFQLGQPLDANDWLNSIEELDRRATLVRERTLYAKRRMRMGYALQKDSLGSAVGNGVFINGLQQGNIKFSTSATTTDNITSNTGNTNMGSTTTNAGFRDVTMISSPSTFSSITANAAKSSLGGTNDDFLNVDLFSTEEEEFLLNSFAGNALPKEISSGRKSHDIPKKYHSGGPYLDAVMAYVEKENFPFQYMDVWVPSFVAPEKNNGSSGPEQNELRLCYSGHTVRRSLLGTNLYASLLEFGEYSSKFSFLQSHGLPGRVFNLGIPNWEQRVDRAPPGHFERCGGASLYGIKTVIGLPVESPSVGRIVLALYSRDDVPKDHNIVAKMCRDIARWNPLPKWKLVVDIATTHGNERYENINSWGNAGEMEQSKNSMSSTLNSHTRPSSRGHMNNSTLSGNPTPSNLHTELKSSNDEEQVIVKLLAKHMPMDTDNSLPGFMSLRLLLLRSPARRSPSEAELLRTIMGSYKSYRSVGRNDSDIAQLLANDFMFLMPNDKAASSFHQGGGGGRSQQTSQLFRNVSFSSASTVSPYGSLNLKEPSSALTQKSTPTQLLPPIDNFTNATLVSDS